MAENGRGGAELIKKLLKDKKALLTVIIGITGMLLVLLSELPSFSDEDEVKADESFFYQQLEQRAEKLISQIDGAGKVSVMLTYASTEETVWATDTRNQSRDTTGSELISEHIILDTDNGENGLAVKVIYPEIRGVAVVCSGADNPQVKSEIKALISALFDIGSNRISIARRAE